MILTAKTFGAHILKRDNVGMRKLDKIRETGKRQFNTIQFKIH